MKSSSTKLGIDFEIAQDIEHQCLASIPSEQQISHWLTVTLDQLNITKPIEMGIKVVNKVESQELNSSYRGKDNATNVLSFESDIPEFVGSNFIGDLAICATIVIDEAAEQNKQIADHWAHIVTHGMLHLLGYDHITEADAKEMEAIEVNALAKLGIDDPYYIS